MAFIWLHRDIGNWNKLWIVPYAGQLVPNSQQCQTKYAFEVKFTNQKLWKLHSSCNTWLALRSFITMLVVLLPLFWCREFVTKVGSGHIVRSRRICDEDNRDIKAADTDPRRKTQRDNKGCGWFLRTMCVFLVYILFCMFWSVCFETCLNITSFSTVKLFIFFLF